MKLFAGLRLGAQKEVGREGEGVPFEGVGWLVRARLGLQSHKKRTADGSQKSHGRKGEEQPLLREGRRETKPGLRTTHLHGPSTPPVSASFTHRNRNWIQISSLKNTEGRESGRKTSHRRINPSEPRLRSPKIKHPRGRAGLSTPAVLNLKGGGSLAVCSAFDPPGGTRRH